MMGRLARRELPVPAFPFLFSFTFSVPSMFNIKSDIQTSCLCVLAKVRSADGR